MSLSELFKEKPPLVTSSSNLPWPSAERSVRVSISSTERHPFLTTSPLWNFKRSPSLREFLNPNYRPKFKTQNYNIGEETIDLLENLKHSGLSKAELLECTKKAAKTPVNTTRQASQPSSSQAYTAKSKKEHPKQSFSVKDKGTCNPDLQNCDVNAAIQTATVNSESDIPSSFGNLGKTKFDQNNDNMSIPSTRILRSHSQAAKGNDSRIPPNTTSNCSHTIPVVKGCKEVKTMQSFILKSIPDSTSKARQSSCTTMKPEMGSATSLMITDIISSVVNESRQKQEDTVHKTSQNKDKASSIQDIDMVKNNAQLLSNVAVISCDSNNEVACSHWFSSNNECVNTNRTDLNKHMNVSLDLATNQETHSSPSGVENTLDFTKITSESATISTKAETNLGVKRKLQEDEPGEDKKNFNEYSPRKKVLSTNSLSTQLLDCVQPDTNESSSIGDQKLIVNHEGIKKTRKTCQDRSKMTGNDYIGNIWKNSSIISDAKHGVVVDDDESGKEVKGGTEAANSYDFNDNSILISSDNNKDKLKYNCNDGKNDCKTITHDDDNDNDDALVTSYSIKDKLRAEADGDNKKVTDDDDGMLVSSDNNNNKDKLKDKSNDTVADDDNGNKNSIGDADVLAISNYYEDKLKDKNNGVEADDDNIDNNSPDDNDVLVTSVNTKDKLKGEFNGSVSGKDNNDDKNSINDDDDNTSNGHIISDNIFIHDLNSYAADIQNGDSCDQYNKDELVACSNSKETLRAIDFAADDYTNSTIDEDDDVITDFNNPNDDVKNISICDSSNMTDKNDNQSIATDSSNEDISETQFSRNIDKDDIDNSIEVLVFSDDSDDNDDNEWLEEGEIPLDDLVEDDLEEKKDYGKGNQHKTKTKKRRRGKKKGKDGGRKMQKIFHPKRANCKVDIRRQSEPKLDIGKSSQISPSHEGTILPSAESAMGRNSDSKQLEMQLEEEQGYSLLASLSNSTVDVTVAASEKELVKKKTRGGKAGAKIRKKLKRKMNGYLERRKKELKQARQRGPPPRPVCHYYLRGGLCNKGAECPFRHKGTPTKLQEVCRYYLVDACNKGDSCPFLHSSFPCKYFHSPAAFCRNGDLCRFSHDRLTPETQGMLDKFLVDQRVREQSHKVDIQDVQPEVDNANHQLNDLGCSQLKDNEEALPEERYIPLTTPVYTVRYGLLDDGGVNPSSNDKSDLESSSKQNEQMELQKAAYLVPGMYLEPKSFNSF